MKKTILGIFISFGMSAQVAIQCNLPREIPVSSQVDFIVRIGKGDLTHFSKYEMVVPDGIILREIDSHGGTFTFENNRARIVWAITPPENEYAIRLLAITGTITGNQKIEHTYYFVVNNEKREIEMEPLNFSVSASPGIKHDTQVFRKVSSRLPSAATTNLQADSLKKPEELDMQVKQLKKDSKDAYEVGMAEKQNAEARLAKAEEALSAADKLSGSGKQVALKKAKDDRAKAIADIEVASKILLLARTLEDNANEIERLSAPQEKVTDSVVVSPKVTPETGSYVVVPVEDEEIVYRLQVGAFSKDPGKSRYRRYGDVHIENEHGIYRVLIGSYKTREEASSEKDRLSVQGLQGFIVSYRDGVRIK